MKKKDAGLYAAFIFLASDLALRCGWVDEGRIRAIVKAACLSRQVYGDRCVYLPSDETDPNNWQNWYHRITDTGRCM